MKAVILVGGEGTRLRPLTCNTPKPMLPLMNVPFLAHSLGYLRAYGITDIVLSMCYRPDVIERYFGDGSSFGVSLTYVVEETPLGTAGGVKNVESHLDGTFFVFNGDILTDLDIGAMLEFHRSKGATATISLTPVDDPTAYGLVETSAEGKVKAFVEKPSWDRITSNLINAGTYILEPEILRHVPPNSFFMFERGLFPLLLQRGDPVFGYPSDAYWLDIGTPQKYLAAHHDGLTKRIAIKMPGDELREGIWLGAGCQIDQTATLVPPVVLGQNVRLADGAAIIGPAVIDDDCEVGNGALVEGSVVWRRTIIGSRASIKSSLVGSASRIGEGALICGGTVIADGCQIGAGNHLDHGIRIWPSRRIEANTITF